MFQLQGLSHLNNARKQPESLIDSPETKKLLNEIMYLQSSRIQTSLKNSSHDFESLNFFGNSDCIVSSASDNRIPDGSVLSYLGQAGGPSSFFHARVFFKYHLLVSCGGWGQLRLGEKWGQQSTQLS